LKGKPPGAPKRRFLGGAAGEVNAKKRSFFRRLSHEVIYYPTSKALLKMLYFTKAYLAAYFAAAAASTAPGGIE
jgi:hypothetical protein